MASERLNQAIALIKAGNKPAALPILKEVVQANPRDENAWLWLYACVDTVEQKKACLQKALEINPANLDAHVALGKLTAPPPRPAPTSRPPANRNDWLFALGIAALFLFACLIMSGLYLAQNSQLSTLAAGLPLFPSATLTPTPTPTATATLTPTPTATFGPEQIAPLEGMDSYRLEGKITMQGIAGGNFPPIIWSFTQEWDKASLAQHSISSVEGIPAFSATVTPGQTSTQVMEIIVIGNTAWVKSLNDEWTRVDSPKPLYRQYMLTNFVSDWQSLKPAGSGIVNGIPCNRYSIDEDTLKMSGAGLGGPDVTTHARGDIWVANRSDLPSVILRMKIQMQVNGFIVAQVTSTPDEFMEVPAPAPPGTTYDYEYEVADINIPITIEPPQTIDVPERQG